MKIRKKKELFGKQFIMKQLTWLYQPHVEYLVDLRVIGSDVEYAFWRVLDAGDVHGHQVFGNLLPLHGAGVI